MRMVGFCVAMWRCGDERGGEDEEVDDGEQAGKEKKEKRLIGTQTLLLEDDVDRLDRGEYGVVELCAFCVAPAAVTEVVTTADGTTGATNGPLPPPTVAVETPWLRIACGGEKRRQRIKTSEIVVKSVNATSLSKQISSYRTFLKHRQRGSRKFRSSATCVCARCGK